MAEIPPGRSIPEADHKRAELFFDKARAIADTQNYEYAIELYLQGLNYDPEAVDKHKAVRELSLVRKAKGGKPLGMFDRNKLKKGDDKQNMLNAEKLLAYDPSSLDYMEQLMVAAQKAGCYDTVGWIGNTYLHANSTSKQPSFQRYMKMKDVYAACGKFSEALDAMNMAVQMKPGDMDLAHELKNLAAQNTIKQAGYDAGEGFTHSIKDKDAQRKLLEQDMDIRSADNLIRAVVEAEQAHAADPLDVGKFNRYVEALRKSEMLEYENRAIELLSQKYKETRAYKFKATINQITLSQYGRQERQEREEYNKNPADPETKKRYLAFVREKTELELKIFKETVEAYPTDNVARFEMGRRLFLLRRWDEAIPVFQQARMDPKYKAQATILLGRAFFEAGFVDEAVDTLQEAIQSYPVRGDEKSIEIHYYCAVALEAKGDTQSAIKMYSQVAQWNFTYRDVQQRIKRLRAANQPPPQAPPAEEG